MNGFERVTRSIDFECPDRIPLFHGCLPVARWKYGDQLDKILSRYPSDLVDLSIYQTHFLGSEDPIFQKGKFVDEWRVVWENVQGGMYGQVVQHPLGQWELIKSYEFPDPLNDAKFDSVEKFIKNNNKQKYVIVWETLEFQRMYFLRGFSNLMVDLFKKPKSLKLLMDRIRDYNIARIKRWIEVDVDGIIFSEDCGTQTGLMINPQLWRDLFKSSKRRMFDILHKAGKHVFYHSDGNVIDIIPDLIECGADGLYVQLTRMLPRMRIDELGHKFGGRICFLSDLDRQHVLPFDTIEEVKELVKDSIRALGSFEGGLIGGAEVGPDVPLTNVKAVYETFEKWGRYPLSDL